jgi:hypothetical protein
VQSGFDTIDHQGVPCVVPPLKTHHASGGFGEPINQFAFAFITPLGANHHDVTAWGGDHGLSYGFAHIDFTY